MPAAGEITLLVAGILAGAVETLKDPAADRTADIEWLNGLAGPLTIDRLADQAHAMHAQAQAQLDAALREALDAAMRTVDGRLDRAFAVAETGFMTRGRIRAATEAVT